VCWRCRFKKKMLFTVKSDNNKAWHSFLYTLENTSAMEEKTTKGTPETNQGLNKNNPNTERTPIDIQKTDTGLVGGTAQSNYEDEQEGEVKRNNEEEANRH
jgi:hypothetical protein